jgi:hypothetical protein
MIATGEFPDLAGFPCLMVIKVALRPVEYTLPESVSVYPEFDIGKEDLCPGMRKPLKAVFGARGTG